jgi:hypothetical protein
VDGRIAINLFGVWHVGVDGVAEGLLVGRGSRLCLGAPVTLDQLAVERVLLLDT